MDLNFPKSTDEKTEAFLSIFKLSFVESFVDFDAITSLKIATSLTLGLDSFPKWVQKDFETLANFCSKEKNLGIIKGECANFVVELVKLNANKRNRKGEALSVGISEAFISGYDYFTKEEDGPKLANYDAIKQLIKILKVSPYGVSRFEKMYEFAIDDMKVTRDEAIGLATNVALRSRADIAFDPKEDD